MAMGGSDPGRTRRETDDSWEERLEARIRAEVEKVRAEARAEIEKVRAEGRGEVARVRAEGQAEARALRREVEFIKKTEIPVTGYRVEYNLMKWIAVALLLGLAGASLGFTVADRFGDHLAEHREGRYGLPP